jgi:hypothetical protein
MSEKFKVFIENHEAYNAGEMIGEWIELPITHEEFTEVLKRIGVADKNGRQKTDYIITDWENVPDNIRVFRYETIEILNKYGELLEKLSYNEIEAVAEAFEIHSLNELVDELERQNYEFYEDADLYDIAKDIFIDKYGRDAFEELKYYINWDKYIKVQIEGNGYVETKYGVVEAF